MDQRAMHDSRNAAVIVKKAWHDRWVYVGETKTMGLPLQEMGRKGTIDGWISGVKFEWGRLPCLRTCRPDSRGARRTPKHQTTHFARRVITQPPWHRFRMRLQQSMRCDQEKNFATLRLLTASVFLGLRCRADTEVVRRLSKRRTTPNFESTHNKKLSSYSISKTSIQERCLPRGLWYKITRPRLLDRLWARPGCRDSSTETTKR